MPSMELECQLLNVQLSSNYKIGIFKENCGNFDIHSLFLSAVQLWTRLQNSTFKRKSHRVIFNEYMKMVHDNTKKKREANLYQNTHERIGQDPILGSISNSINISMSQY